MDIILFGKPGAGKDTLAKYIVDKYGFEEINVGKMYRELAESGDPIGVELKEKYWGSGNLVPSDRTRDMLLKHLKTTVSNNRLFNGYPRNEQQVRDFFSRMAQNDILVIDMIISDETAIDRMLKRGRIDDDPETIKQRIKVYEEQTKACVKLIMENYGTLPMIFDSTGTIEEMNIRFDKKFSKYIQ